MPLSFIFLERNGGLDDRIQIGNEKYFEVISGC